jgi:hypothetical protein
MSYCRWNVDPAPNENDASAHISDASMYTETNDEEKVKICLLS